MSGHIISFEHKLSEALSFINESVTAKEIVHAINQQRKSRDLDLVEPSDELRIAARAHADAMASLKQFGHVLDDAKYPELADRMRLTGYNYSAAGEVLAAGIDEPNRVIHAWLNSPPHRKAILHPDVRDIGASVQYSQDGNPYICAVLCIPSGYGNDDETDSDDIGQEIWQTAKRYGKKVGKRLLAKIAQSKQVKELKKSPIIQKLVAALG